MLSILPPFEGWDEYQHIAAIEFLCENGRSPIMQNDDVVPRSLYEKIVRYPHSALAIDQLRGIGALSYEEFWAAEQLPTVRPNAPALRLYQAQQSPFYYRLVAPLYRFLDDRGGILAAITGLRALNTLFGAAAIYCALWAVGNLLKPGGHRFLLGLLIVLQPLYLINCARVANDALAVLLGTVSVSILLVVLSRHFWMASLGAGLALGLGILSKTIDLSLLPFVVFVYVSYAWHNKQSWIQSSVGLAVCLSAVLVSCGSYLWFNLQHFGMLTPLQEAVLNRDAGHSVIDLFAGLVDWDWWRTFAQRGLRYSLWFGGWSWQKSPTRLMDIHEFNIFLSLVGGFFAMRETVRRRSCLFVEKQTVARLGVLCLSVAAGLAYHALHTQLAYGTFAANSWYAAIAFPWLLCLFCQGLACFPWKWIVRWVSLSMVGVFLTAEVYGGLVQMVHAYTGQGWGRVAWERLSLLHISGLGPGLTFPALGVAIVLMGLVVAVWVRAVRVERE
ncbi:MAG: hypothetical protein ACE5EQ_10390 [Phycisphaerae bacterium]